MSRLKMVRRMAPMAAGIAVAPVRMRRNPPSPPSGAEHYRLPELAASRDQAMLHNSIGTVYETMHWNGPHEGSITAPR